MLQQWDIDYEVITNNDVRAKEKFKARGLAGWEPYAVVGVTHWFKRPIEQVPEEGLIARLQKLWEKAKDGGDLTEGDKTELAKYGMASVVKNYKKKQGK